MSRVFGLGVVIGIFGMVGFGDRFLSHSPARTPQTNISPSAGPVPLIERSASTTDAEWKRILSPDVYHIMREAGTERPFTHPLYSEKRPGTYVSADCGEPLFRSEQKYDSGTGWPSFWAPISPDAVKLVEDTSLFETRTEVVTSKCGGHLGHVFDDGPPPTGKRFCMNGVALRFISDEAGGASSTPKIL